MPSTRAAHELHLSASRRSEFCRSVRLAILIAATARTIAVSAAPPAAPPGDLLAKKGLIRRNAVWIVADEAKYLDYVTNLAALEKRCKDAQAKFDDFLRQSKTATDQFIKLKIELEKIDKAMDAPGTTPLQHDALVPEHNRRVTQLVQMQSLIADPFSQEDNPRFHRTAQELSAARNELTFAILTIRRVPGEIAEKYEPLKADEEVTAALKALGSGARLGPLRDYSKDAPKTASAEKIAFANTLHLYREGQLLVFDVIVNETTAAVVTLAEQQEFSVLPQALLNAAGIKIPDKAPEITITVSVNNKQLAFPSRVVQVPSLRIGKYQIKDVEVLAVADDASKILAPQLGSKALKDYELRLDPNNFRVEIRTAGEPPDAKPPAKSMPPGMPK